MNKFSGYEVLFVSEDNKLSDGVFALRYAPRFLGICALLVGVTSGLIEILLAQFVCVGSCPKPDTIFPWFLSSALEKLLLPTATLLVLAYLAYAGYCLATAQARRLLAPTLTLALGAAVSVGVIVWYSNLFVTMIPIDSEGYLVDGSAQTWTAGLGQITAGLTLVWAGLLTYLQWSPHGSARPANPPVASSTD